MTFSLSSASVHGILLDIEGTTTPIDFVYEILFPFARAHVKDYLKENIDSEEVRSDIAKLKEEHRADPAPPPLLDEPDSIVAYIHWLMDRDRKSTGLKSLQGKIWKKGYLSGKLKGQLFPDVLPAFERWRKNGIDIRIFSSGSILAQKLLFSNTEEGDITKFLNGYFDTTTGAKTVPDSYRKIATAFGLPPSEILFISDVTAELDAAREAGMQTLLCLRPGNRPEPLTHEKISSFSEIE